MKHIETSSKSDKGALRFAPNFTAYVLPPDAVCLYSEDRKFFLHGEIYCAIATAIGKGGKSFAELAQQLERTYPPEQVHDALKGLMERRYIVPASPDATMPPGRPN